MTRRRKGDLPQELFPERSPKTIRTFRSTLSEMWPIFPAELLLSGVMLGIYAIVGRFSVRILYSAALGTGLVLLNFAAMIFSLIRAERYDSRVSLPRAAVCFCGCLYLWAFWCLH